MLKDVYLKREIEYPNMRPHGKSSCHRRCFGGSESDGRARKVCHDEQKIDLF